MPHLIWHYDLLIGTIDLPAGQLVACRLQPGDAYLSVATIVQRSTRAFLHLGLFHTEWVDAINEASRLRLTLTNEQREIIATHFINLLEPVIDEGVVVLISLDDEARGNGATTTTAPQDPSQVNLRTRQTIQPPQTTTLMHG